MITRRFEAKLQRKETTMTNAELINLFSRSKAFVDMIKELNNSGLVCALDENNTLISQTDWQVSWHTDKNESFEFMTHFTSLHFAHNDGHRITIEVALRSNFKLKSKGQYDADDVEKANKLIEESYDFNSKSLKPSFNGGTVFVSSPSYYNDKLISEGYTDTIEGGFATVVKCLNDDDYATEKIGLAHHLV